APQAGARRRRGAGGPVLVRPAARARSGPGRGGRGGPADPGGPGGSRVLDGPRDPCVDLGGRPQLVTAGGSERARPGPARVAWLRCRTPRPRPRPRPVLGGRVPGTPGPRAGPRPVRGTTLTRSPRPALRPGRGLGGAVP